MTEIPGMVEQQVARAIVDAYCGHAVAAPNNGEIVPGDMDAARAAIAAHEAALRDAGMVIVSKEATDAMVDAVEQNEPFLIDCGEGYGWAGFRPAEVWRAMIAAAHRCSTTNPESTSPVGGTKLWLWKNGDHYLAYAHEYPTYGGGDPMTLGEPMGWAIFQHSDPPSRSPHPPTGLVDIGQGSNTDKTK